MFLPLVPKRRPESKIMLNIFDPAPDSGKKREKPEKTGSGKNPENPDPDFPDFLPTFPTQNLAVNRKCKASFFI